MAVYAQILAAIAVICVVAYQFLETQSGKVESVTEGLVDNFCIIPTYSY
jgi:hypothetical protein